jgi:hypothetical protein
MDFFLNIGIYVVEVYNFYCSEHKSCHGLSRRTHSMRECCCGRGHDKVDTMHLHFCSLGIGVDFPLFSAFNLQTDIVLKFVFA